MTSRALAAALALALPSIAAAQQKPPAKPTLVVQITIDQLRPDYLDKWAPQFTGGLKRLLQQGAFFTQAYHEHATTETAPGHATLWSGRTPAHTNIVINDLGVADAQMPLLLGRGGGASPWRFRGSALFDWIRARDQFARALSVSRKDRGAILPLGKAKQQVYWYGLDGRFTTSRYYADTLPTWVQQFNARDLGAQYLGKTWTPLLADAAYPEKDSVAYEHEGKDIAFPHALGTDRRRGLDSLTSFPWMDEFTVDMALAGVQAMDLGKGPTTDVLALSLSSTDAVGHAWGPDSKELHDQVLRVDRALGRFIDSLYTLRDSSRIVFALGADHGVTPYPEAAFPGANPDRGRVDVRPVIDAARSSLVARGLETDALNYQDKMLMVDRRRFAAAGIDADSTIESVRAALLKLPGMAAVYRVRDLPRLAATDKIARRWLNALPADMQVALAVTFKEGYYVTTTRYATHGMPHDLDAHIPVLFMGPGVKPGRYTMPIRSVDVAPTLAELAQVMPFEVIDGRVLTQALISAPRTAGRAKDQMKGSRR
jgi:arylsulfatase A-like enzyme